MGYTHYWYKPHTLEQPKWDEFIADCQKIDEYAQKKLGIILANGHGEPATTPEYSRDRVSMNGSDAQPIGVWTTDEQVSIPWPAETASIDDPKADPVAKKTDGNWFAGTLLTQRVAPLGENGMGEGSYETFYIQRVEDDDNPIIRDGLHFGCTKTAYRPYDLPITAMLIALKHHFPACRISSDGEEKDWLDGKILCNNLLGYGLDFTLNNE